MPSRSAYEVFLERLEELIEDGDARAVAERAGINEVTLSNWRTGANPPNPTLRTLVALAKALNVTPCYLISDGAAGPLYSPREVERLLRLADDEENASKMFRNAVRETLRKL